MGIHILSYNIHKGIGWRIRKSTMDRICSEIAELKPNIIFLQEIRGHQLEKLSSEISLNYSYGQNATHRQGHYGNAILSKFPIVFSKNIDLSMHRFESRGLLHSIIQLPEKNLKLHLLCVHLGLFQNDRKIQMNKIIEFIQTNIPDNEHLILGGDFNDWAQDGTNALIRSFGLEEAFLNLHNSYARTYPAWAPFFRLDRLYYRGLDVKHVNRFTKKPWKYLSDHIAIDAIFEYSNHD